MISKLKPTVWTLHDPWALTGHCIHPFGCERWKIGCGQCPDLETHLALKRDTTKFLFSYKKKCYENSNLEIVVSSKWMRSMVEASPLFRNARLHEIPFGLDLNFFSPGNPHIARKRFGIPDDALVISFRAELNPYKGVPYILEALEKIETDLPIYLLTLSSGVDLKSHFKDKYEVIQLGWENDQEVVRDFFRASDIFLMPSLAESFGMMAVEAMACQVPVIVFEGTALPDITFAPDVGIAVPQKDSDALSQAIQRLIDSPQERLARGEKGRKIAEQRYGEKLHVESIANLYHEVVERFNANRILKKEP